MDYSKAYILKVNFHCPAYEKKLYRALEDIKGVSSISIDRENGKVMVSGNVDPYALRLALEKAGTKADISWEHNSAVNSHQNNRAYIAQPTSAQAFSPHTDAQMEQLHRLSLTEGLERVEVKTHSKSFSMIFNGYKDDSSQSTDVNATQTPRAAGPSRSTGSSHGHVNTHYQCYQHEVAVPPYANATQTPRAAGPSRSTGSCHGHVNTHYQCYHHEVAVPPNANANCNGCGPVCMSSCIPPSAVPPAYNRYSPGPPPSVATPPAYNRYISPRNQI